MDDPEFTSKLKTLYLGAAAGSRRLYVNIDLAKPGAKSVKYHSHSLQEEFFLIFDGEGVLRMEGEEIPVKKGDFVAKLQAKELPISSLIPVQRFSRFLTTVFKIRTM